jgi:hypothetical protein
LDDDDEDDDDDDVAINTTICRPSKAFKQEICCNKHDCPSSKQSIQATDMLQ